MHRPSLGIGLASMIAAMASFGKGVETFTRTLHEAEPSLADLVATMRPRKMRGPGRKSYRLTQPSPAYRARQHQKQRWLRGERVPTDVRIALEEAAEARRPILERRAYAARRHAESQVIRRLNRQYDRACEELDDPKRIKPVADLLRDAHLLWQHKEPFPPELMAA